MHWRPIVQRGLAILVAVVAAALLLGLAEIGLRLAGFGFDPHFVRRDRVAGEPVLRENQDFGRTYFPDRLLRRPEPFLLDAAPPAKPYRIVVLGASAAQGDPDPAFSFARQLEVLLRAAYPGQPVEVVNAAMTAINSHVVVSIAQDLERIDPDLYIVYLGNNEVIGPYGPGTSLTAVGRSRSAIRASIGLSRNRLGQAGRKLVGRDQAPTSWGGMEMFLEHRIAADDPRLERVYAHYRANLDAIVDAAADADADVLLATVLANLEQPPFAGEAATQAWRGGRQARREGRIEAARESLARARDLDELRFRADSRLNAIVREVAESAGDRAQLVDAAAALAEQSPDGIPGERFLWEHVHFTFEGAYQTALLFFDAVTASWLAEGRIDAPVGALPLASVAEALVHTADDRARIAREVHRRLTSPPFLGLELSGPALRVRRQAQRAERDAAAPAEVARRLRLLDQALQRRPRDLYLLLARGRYDDATGQPAQAVPRYRETLRLYPHVPAVRYQLGRSLVQSGDTAAGRPLLEQVAADRPSGFTDLYNLLGQLAMQRGAVDEAQAWYQTATEVNDQNAGAHLQLAEIHLSRGESAAADAAVEAAIAIRPDEPRAYALAGQIYLRHGRRERARSHFERAVRLDPANPSLRGLLQQAGGS